MNGVRSGVGRRGKGRPGRRRLHQSVALALGFLFSFALAIGGATPAAAESRDCVRLPERLPEGISEDELLDMEGRDICAPASRDCLYIAEDIWGFLFSFYCVESGQKGTYKEEHGASTFGRQRDGYMNGGLGDCEGLHDDWQSHATTAMNDILGLVGLGWPGGGGTITECVKRRMLEWLQDHANDNLGQPVDLELEDNPCNSIYDWRPQSDKNNDNCRSPFNQNPCLLIGTGQFVSDDPDPDVARDKVDVARQSCLDDHPGFKQQTGGQALADDGGCEFLSGNDRDNCEALVEQSTEAAPTTDDMRRRLSSGLGWMLLFVSCACWVGIVFGGARMAMIWWTGEPGMLQVSRFGWRIFAVIGAASAPGIVGFFML